jgi:hypothetical protein
VCGGCAENQERNQHQSNYELVHVIPLWYPQYNRRGRRLSTDFAWA